MPALPDVPNTLRISLRFSTTGVLEAGVRFFYTYSGGPPTVGNLNTLATAIAGYFGTNLAGLMSTDYHLIAITIVDLSSSIAAEGEWTGSVAGANAGHPPAIDAVLLQNFQISRRFRGGKPRTYWPFGIEGNLNVDDVTWESSFLTTAAAGWAAFNAALVATTGVGMVIVAHVNVSYYHGFASVQNPVTKRWKNIPTPVAGPVSPDIIIGNVFRPEISVQRRRRTSLS
jgi:hypothetical protein